MHRNRRTWLKLTLLERRDAPAVATLAGGTLVVAGTPESDRIDIGLDVPAQQYVVRDRGVEIGRFATASVTSAQVTTGDGDDVVKVAREVTLPVSIDGGDGRDKIAGGDGPQTLTGGAGDDLLKPGDGPANIDATIGRDKVYDVKPFDALAATPSALVAAAGAFAPVPSLGPDAFAITQQDIEDLLGRAAAASSSEDAIIAVVDRSGNILGVRAEPGIAAEIQGNSDLLTFAIDGAVAKARTAAFFSSNEAPLTSRTVRFISQSTITQREVESYPFVNDAQSIIRGPGYVAPVGSAGHFPPDVPLTPQVDLFAIEHTNRDSIISPGSDHLRATADDITRSGRFNINPMFVPAGKDLFAPESYGFAFGDRRAQSRGIATLPGGIPLYKNGVLVGGIGVFFPGKTGFASEENSSLSTNYDPTKPDRTLEAEFMAFVAAGGAPGIGFPAPTVSGLAPVPGYQLPLTEANQRIDLVGITLDIVGPGGIDGPENLVKYGQSLKPGNPFTGANQPVAPAQMFGTFRTVPDGWLVVPHDGVGITKDQVTQVILQGIAQAERTRAAIRLPLDNRTKMVFAVTDAAGEVVGLFRMPDATVFSIDVAVAKARNARYYADATRLQAVDQVQGVPAGTAFTARTFRYLAEPRLPEGIDAAEPGPFSIFTDSGADRFTGRSVGPNLPASAYQSALGFDSFNPESNFHDPTNPANQNGVVFFPGSAPLYFNGLLIGGLGVSGDGVDQDDVVTALASEGFKVPSTVLRADQAFFRDVRLPYQKFNRNPEN